MPRETLRCESLNSQIPVFQLSQIPVRRRIELATVQCASFTVARGIRALRTGKKAWQICRLWTQSSAKIRGNRGGLRGASGLHTYLGDMARAKNEDDTWARASAATWEAPWPHGGPHACKKRDDNPRRAMAETLIGNDDNTALPPH